MVIPLPMLEDLLVFTAGIVGMTSATAVLTTWIKSRGPKNGMSREALGRLDEIAERMTRMENAIDSVAVEVERISESQRFTTKLFAERSAAPALPERGRAPGTTTPH